jgi:transposase-like protein
MSDSKESIWTKLGVFFGAYFRCPSCKFAHEKHEIRKERTKRKFKEETHIQPGLVDKFYNQMAIFIISNHTYECPHCRYQWTEEHEERVTEYEEDITK